MDALIRDYNHISQRLNTLKWDYIHSEILGRVNDYPIYSLRLAHHHGQHLKILLSAGTHGDEPAGTEAVLRFLQRDNTHLLQNFDFLVVPCINPYGYVHNQRENASGIDINRSFEHDQLVEVAIIKRLLKNQRFDLFIEFHEDWEFDGFYLFEVQRYGQSLANQIVTNVATVCPIYHGTAIGEMPVSNRIVQVDIKEAEQMNGAAMPLYVFKYHCDHIITCETPSQLDFGQRVEAHLVALDTVLAHYR